MAACAQPPLAACVVAAGGYMALSYFLQTSIDALGWAVRRVLPQLVQASWRMQDGNTPFNLDRAAGPGVG
jgi:hypothetical protein